MQKKNKIIIAIIVVLVVIFGGGYFYASHSVARHVPGHVYQYTSVSGNQSAYMTFAKSGDEVVVTPSKSKALKANDSQSDFGDVYHSESKQGTWNYSAKGSKLTLSKSQDGKVSLWQYNHVLALGKKLHSSSFTYQIANAGQGVDHKSTSFKQIE